MLNGSNKSKNDNRTEENGVNTMLKESKKSAKTLYTKPGLYKTDVRTTVRILQDDIYGLWVKHNMVDSCMWDPLPEGTNTDAIFALLDGCVEFGRLTTIADDILATILKHYRYKDYEELPMDRMVNSYRELSRVLSSLDDIIRTIFEEYEYENPAFEHMVEAYRNYALREIDGIEHNKLTIMSEDFEYLNLPFKTLVDGYRELVKLSSNGDAPYYARMRANDAVHCLDALYFSSDDKVTKAIKDAIAK